MDENDALIDDQAALEYEYFSTVKHMAQIANEKRDKIKFTCDLVPILLRRLRSRWIPRGHMRVSVLSDDSRYK